MRETCHPPAHLRLERGKGRRADFQSCAAPPIEPRPDYVLFVTERNKAQFIKGFSAGLRGHKRVGLSSHQRSADVQKYVLESCQ